MKKTIDKYIILATVLCITTILSSFATLLEVKYETLIVLKKISLCSVVLITALGMSLLIHITALGKNNNKKSKT